VSFFGEWNWWFPDSFAKLLRVKSAPEPATETAT
jgi:hypothetical protein